MTCVDETTYRTLTALSRNIGRPLSITGLVHEIRRLHKSAYYANIYHAVRGLMRDGVLESSRIGRSSAVSLNLTAYPVTDLLAETEIRQKRAILASDPAARGAFTDLEGAFRRHGVEFACATQIQRNLRLRRLELRPHLSRARDREKCLQQPWMHPALLQLRLLQEITTVG